MVIFRGRSVVGSKIVNFTEKLLIMADNYLEKRYDEYVARKEAEQRKLSGHGKNSSRHIGKNSQRSVRKCVRRNKKRPLAGDAAVCGSFLERKTGFEPATFGLGSRRSTN